MRFILHPEHKAIRGNAIVFIQELAEDKTWDVVITEHRESKSTAQLGYLWSTVLPTICQHVEDATGDHYTSENVYSWMIDEFAEHTVVTVNGRPKVIRVSASKMSTKQMSAFIDRIIMFAAEELSCVIPEPQ